MRQFLVSVTTLIAFGFGAAMPTIARAQEATASARSEGGIVEFSVDVNGRSLHVACAGGGSPTVLYELGGPDAEGGTSSVIDAGPYLADAMGTRYCSYDRAGTGQSDPDPIGVRTTREAAADLVAVLASPDLGCPCVVIGESLGGSIALMALAEDPSRIGGLLLLDAPYPGFFDEFIGLAPADAPEAAFDVDPYLTGENEERLDQVTGFRQVPAPAAAPAFPVIVVTHGAGHPPPCFPCSPSYPVEQYEAAWQLGEIELAEGLGARHVVAEGTSHFIAEENSDLVIGVLVELIAAVRDPGSWATPAA